jgi:uncharacterized protein YegP (UPF0339 family)
MGKLFRAAVLFAGIGALMSAGGLITVAPAQVKDKDKKDAKAADEIGVTEVYMAKDGWRFRIKNAEGKSIAIGTVGHDKKEDALKTVELVKHTLTKGKVEVLKEEKK